MVNTLYLALSAAIHIHIISYSLLNIFFGNKMCGVAFNGGMVLVFPRIGNVRASDLYAPSKWQ